MYDIVHFMCAVRLFRVAYINAKTVGIEDVYNRVEFCFTLNVFVSFFSVDLKNKMLQMSEFYF